MSPLRTNSPPEISRRTILIGSAAAAIGTGAFGGRRSVAVANDGSVDGIGSATVWTDGVVALVTDPDGNVTVTYLQISDTGQVSIGSPIDVDLPADFHPHSVAAMGDRLWITGAVDELVEVITVDNRVASAADRDPAAPEGVFDMEIRRSVPGLVRVDGGATRYADLPVPAAIASGVATAIQVVGDHRVAVAIDGCPDADVAMVTRSHIATSRDGGASWRHRLISRGLGEGYSALLAMTDDRAFAITAAGSDAQTIHRTAAGFDTALQPVTTVAHAGKPIAATIAGDELIVFSDHEGRVRQANYELDGSAAPTAGPSSESCGCATQVITIQGAPGAWIESDGTTARAHGL